MFYIVHKTPLCFLYSTWSTTWSHCIDSIGRPLKPEHAIDSSWHCRQGHWWLTLVCEHCVYVYAIHIRVKNAQRGLGARGDIGAPSPERTVIHRGNTVKYQNKLHRLNRLSKVWCIDNSLKRFKWAWFKGHTKNTPPNDSNNWIFWFKQLDFLNHIIDFFDSNN